MKNITLSAQEDIIDRARKAAQRQHKTLNSLFRDWLEDVANGAMPEQSTNDRLEDLWKSTSRLQVGRKLTRDEINER